LEELHCALGDSHIVLEKMQKLSLEQCTKWLNLKRLVLFGKIFEQKDFDVYLLRTPVKLELIWELHFLLHTSPTELLEAITCFATH
jgi:hypothetical protein